MESYCVLLIVFIPLLSILFLPLLKTNRLLYHLIIGALAVINTGLSFTLPQDHHPLFYFFGIEFWVDKYGWLFVNLVNLAWLITIIYSYAYSHLNYRNQQFRYYLFLPTVISATLGNGLSGNLITVFVFYVAGLLLSYPLITFKKSTKHKAAGKLFLISTLTPAFLLFLPAVIYIYITAHTVSFHEGAGEIMSHLDTPASSLLLVLFVFGLSVNSVFPFNQWLAKVSIAPVPVNGLLHSVAVVKAASIAFIKIAVYVFTLEKLKLLTDHFLTGGWLMYLCGITAIYAAWKAYKTDDMVERFSFSTISQLSYILIAILVGTKVAVLSGIMHVMTHSLAKMALFFVAGYFIVNYHSSKLVKVGEIVPYTKGLVLVVAFMGLSIIGFPFMAGFYSKDLMLIEEFETHNYAAASFLLIGSFINVLYIYPIIKSSFFPKQLYPIVKKELPLPMAIAIGLCVLFTVLISFFAEGYFYNVLK